MRLCIRPNTRRTDVSAWEIAHVDIEGHLHNEGEANASPFMKSIA